MKNDVCTDHVARNAEREIFSSFYQSHIFVCVLYYYCLVIKLRLILRKPIAQFVGANNFYSYVSHSY